MTPVTESESAHKADAEERQEWIESLDALLAHQGEAATSDIVHALLDRATQRGVQVPGVVTTPHINTIDVADEPTYPGDEATENRYRDYLRWNSAVMVTRAQRPGVGVGGHISSYASVATLYEVGLNHFFHGKDHPGGGDSVYFQGHASPECTRAASWKDAWTPTGSMGSARSSPTPAADSPPIPTRA